MELMTMRQKIENFIQQRPRTSLGILVAVVIIFIAFFEVLHQFQSGTVIIYTNSNKNNITISNLNGNSVVVKTQGSLQTSLPIGQFTVTVSEQSSSIKRVITVKARKTESYTLNLSSPLVPYAVLPFGALSVVANASVMYYVNFQDHLLYKIGSSGIPTALNTSIEFGSVQWLSPQYGVGVSIDNSSLYLISNDNIQQLTLPFNGSNISYSLLSSGQLVICDGNNVYIGTPGSSFKKIYSYTKASLNILSTSPGDIILELKTSTESGDDEPSVVINLQGEVIPSPDDLSAYNFKWSPNGKTLITTDDSGTYLYNDKLQRIGQLADGNVIGIAWLNDNTVLYGLGVNLYSYNIDTKDSTLLASTEADRSISGIYPSTDGSTIYLLTGSNNNNETYDTEKVGLTTTQQNIPSYYYELGAFFPSYISQCSFTYTNVFQPILIISSWNDAGTCTTAAQNELSADNLPGSLPIVLSQVVSNE
jgi:hypothetical protein